MKKAFNYSIFIVLVLLSGVLNWGTMKDSVLLNNVEENFKFQGIIEEVKWKKEGEAKYLVRIKKMADNGWSCNLNEKTILKLIGEKEIGLGDRIIFNGKLQRPLKNTNPKLFNYRLRLLSEKIYTTMTIKDHSIVGIDNENRSFKYTVKRSFKKNIEELFDTSLNKDNSSLMKSIVLGEYGYLEEEDISKYREIGLAHILAVSGLHIAIIGSFLVFFLSHLGIKRKKVYSLTLSLIWFYGFLIGFPASLLRANIMMSVLFLARILAEPYDPMNSLVLSMFILLIFNPFWIFSVGFQLSFIATASIIYFTPKIQRLFYPYKDKRIYALAGILGVQIGLLPIQAYYFNQIPILGIVTNLIIAPVLSLALVLAGAMVGMSYSLTFINFLLGPILNIILSLQFKLVDIFYQMPYGRITTPSPNISEIILYYFVLLLVFRVGDLKKIKANIKKVILYYLILYIIFTSIIIIRDQSIEIHFIDVGQGDSILIRSRNGDYLIDTGGNLFASFDIGENITLPYLKKHGVRKLKGVFITHFHEDHSKALPLLIDNIKIENVLISYRNPNSPAYNSIIEKRIPYTILKEGDKFSLDQNIFGQVLSPNNDFVGRNLKENDLSLVFLLRYYSRELLFTGDMEEEVENYLLSKLNKPIDIIKVPHHGSNTSSKKELLNKIRPKFAIITVGRNNLYGHPRKEVLNRYKEIGSQIYRTDTMGRIKIKLNKEDMEIEGFLKDQVSIFQYIDDYVFKGLYYLLYYLIFYILIRIYIFTQEEELN